MGSIVMSKAQRRAAHTTLASPLGRKKVFCCRMARSRLPLYVNRLRHKEPSNTLVWAPTGHLGNARCTGSMKNAFKALPINRRRMFLDKAGGQSSCSACCHMSGLSLVHQCGTHLQSDFTGKQT